MRLGPRRTLEGALLVFSPQLRQGASAHGARCATSPAAPQQRLGAPEARLCPHRLVEHPNRSTSLSGHGARCATQQSQTASIYRRPIRIRVRRTIPAPICRRWGLRRRTAPQLQGTNPSPERAPQGNRPPLTPLVSAHLSVPRGPALRAVGARRSARMYHPPRIYTPGSVHLSPAPRGAHQSSSLPKLTSSTSKRSVAPPGILGGDPRSPYA